MCPVELQPTAADALTGGFAWLFLGAAALAVLGAAVVAVWPRD